MKTNEENVLQGHNEDVTGLAFSFDGTALATACEDKCVRVYKMQDLKAKNISSIKHQMTAVPIDVAFGATTSQVATTTRGQQHATWSCHACIAGPLQRHIAQR